MSKTDRESKFRKKFFYVSVEDGRRRMTSQAIWPTPGARNSARYDERPETGVPATSHETEKVV